MVEARCSLLFCHTVLACQRQGSAGSIVGETGCHQRNSPGRKTKPKNSQHITVLTGATPQLAANRRTAHQRCSQHARHVLCPPAQHQGCCDCPYNTHTSCTSVPHTPSHTHCTHTSCTTDNHTESGRQRHEQLPLYFCGADVEVGRSPGAGVLISLFALTAA